MANYLLQQEAINGKAGTAFCTIDNVIRPLVMLQSLQVDADFGTEDFNVVGANVTQHRINGLTYSGSATIYYGSPYFLDIVLQYQNTGVHPPVEIQVVNNDISTQRGRQTISLYNVIFGTVPMARLDANASTLTGDITFTFSEARLIDRFNTTYSQLGTSAY